MSMYEESYPEKRKKIVGIIMICIALLLIIWVTSGDFDRGPGRDTTVSSSTFDLSSTINATSKEPPIDKHGYIIRERRVLNDYVTTKGMILAEYKKEFANVAKVNYDVESYFKDFARDMEVYAKDIEIARSDIQAMRPQDSEIKTHQAEVIDRLNRLEASVLEYKNHMNQPRDTIDYLAKVQHEYRRVGDIML